MSSTYHIFLQELLYASTLCKTGHTAPYPLAHDEHPAYRRNRENHHDVALHTLPNNLLRAFHHHHTHFSSTQHAGSLWHGNILRGTFSTPASVSTRRTAKSALATQIDGIVDCAFRRADVTVPATVEGAPASMAAGVHVECFLTHGHEPRLMVVYLTRKEGRPGNVLRIAGTMVTLGLEIYIVTMNYVCVFSKSSDRQYRLFSKFVRNRSEFLTFYTYIG